MILLPTFETSQMVKRKGTRRRVINKKVVRQMLTWRHFDFKQRLIAKAREYPWVKVVIVDESYTSKTCGWCGAAAQRSGFMASRRAAFFPESSPVFSDKIAAPQFYFLVRLTAPFYLSRALLLQTTRKNLQLFFFFRIRFCREKRNRMANITLDKSKTAFLLMDFQQGIVSRIPGANDLVPNVQKALLAARAAKIQVAHVRVAFTEADYATIPSTNKAFAQVSKYKGATDGTDATKLVDALAPIDGEIVVTKKRYGALSTTDLHEQLQVKGINTLVISGISTSGVVLSTIRDAADKDYALIAVSDLIADPEAEVHKVLIEKVFPKQADVIDLAALLPLFQ